MNKKKIRHYREKAEKTAKKQRKIQKAIENIEKDGDSQDGSTPVQAGARDQPENPLPEQHKEKPGMEQELDPEPQYMAPDYKGSGKLEDKVAVITGADSGIGRAVAILYAREGADVAITYLSEHEDAKKTKKIVEEEGRNAMLLSGDASDLQFCEDAVEQIIEELGDIDILVNNAGFQEHVYGIENLSEEHFDMTMKTNLYSYYNMAKAVIPHLSSGDTIINTGSVNGFFGHKMLLDYSMTKGGIHAFTQSLAKNLVEDGIRVNAVAPGPVWTPLNPADAPAETIESFGANDPMNRPAQPEEISPAYVFLAAPVSSSYITGQVVGVMGGVTTS